jgi:hypothetical protein
MLVQPAPLAHEPTHNHPLAVPVPSEAYIQHASRTIKVPSAMEIRQRRKQYGDRVYIKKKKQMLAFLDRNYFLNSGNSQGEEELSEFIPVKIRLEPNNFKRL